MRGVILAGGRGVRLLPAAKITNKIRKIIVFPSGVFILIILFSAFHFSSFNFSVNAFEATSTSFQIHSSAIDSIAGTGTSTNFQNISAGGQEATGISTSTAYNLYSGILYWLTELPQSIQLTIDPGTLGLGSLTPGAAVTGTSTATVAIIGGTDGYSLRFKRDSADSTLASSSPTTLFPDYTPAWDPAANGGNGNATTTPGANFSFRVRQGGTTSYYNSVWWGGNDNEGTAKYGGAPVSSRIIMNCATCNSGSTDTVTKYRADSPYDQPIGNYTGSVTYTALINL